jgi:hypothetical protein
LQAKSKSKPEMTAAEKDAECQLVEQVALVLANSVACTTVTTPMRITSPMLKL